MKTLIPSKHRSLAVIKGGLLLDEERTLEVLPQQVLNGVVIGSGYALVALGLTMVYGILNVANFAHGQIYMLGAYTTWVLLTILRFDFFVAMICSMVLVALVGVGAERVAFRPLRGAPTEMGFIAALGLGLTLQEIAARIWGNRDQVYPTLYEQTVNLFGLSITAKRLLIVGVTAALLLMMYFLIQKTAVGRAIRAVAQEPRGAQLVGININRVSSATFAIGSALAAAAGSLLGSMFLINPTMGTIPVIKAFVVIILGGMGSMPGAIIGAYALGIAETLGATYVSSAFMDLYAFVVLIAVLSIKPTGIFGRAAT